jgi:hypothetical protein
MKDRRFGPNGQGFRSASEITTVLLVPKTNASGVAGPAGDSPLQRYNNTANWWDDKNLSDRYRWRTLEQQQFLP